MYLWGPIPCIKIWVIDYFEMVQLNYKTSRTTEN